MEFICEKCDRKLKTKQSLQNHIKKNACKVYDFFCEFCGKGYTKKTNLYRHMRTSCKLKTKGVKNKESVYDMLTKFKNENEQIRKEMKELDKKHLEQIEEIKKSVDKKVKIQNITNQNINNVTNQNINNGTVNNVGSVNIALIAYGREDFSKLDKMEILKVLKTGFNSCTGLTEVLHFNPKYPEYQNIYIPNMKNKYAMIYNGNDWNLTTKEELIDKIYDDKKNYIEENLDEYVGLLTNSQKNALKRWLDTDDEDQKILRIKESIRLLLYNKRNVVLDTFAKSGNNPKRKIKRVIKDGDDENA